MADEQRITVKEIIAQYLKDHDLDGLISDSDECVCVLEDLMECGDNCGDCVPGYRVPCPSDCGDHDFHISEKKEDK